MNLAQDLRYAARTLRKNPSFSIIAVVCLAVGIATNTTLFSCLNAIVLRPLPFPAPDELAIVVDRDTANADNSTAISYPTYRDWREQSRSFTGLGATVGRSLVITEGEEPERLFGQLVSANLFPILGIKPQLGRNFREDEDQPGAAGVVILGDAVWKRRFGADSGVLNRVISINGSPFTIVGVMPPRFQFPEEAELWVPMSPFLANDRRDARSLIAYGRMKEGVSPADATKDLRAISRRLNDQFDPRSRFLGNAKALREEFVEPEVKQITATMFGAVTLVLLIACANVANLMLTRSAGRQRELAVRAALGAGRGRIIRQLLTESLILASVAGALAIPLTWLGLKLIDRGIPAENPLPWYFHWGVDRETLVYTGFIALMTSVVFGLIPALQVSRGKLYDALREGGGRGAFGSKRSNRTRSALVIGEVALSLVLLVGASLFARTFFGLQTTSVGFDTSKMMSLRFYMPGQRYDSATAVNTRVQDIIRRVEALPNVEYATASNSLPFATCCFGSSIRIEGQTVERGREPAISWTAASGHWFEALGVKLIAGRTFNETELETRAPVAVIDQRMADKFWPKGALGQHFRLTYDTSAVIEVIGISPTVRVQSLGDTDVPQPMAVLPYRFLTARNTALMVRVRNGTPESVMQAVRTAIRDADPILPVFEVQSVSKAKNLSFWQYKLFSQMFGAFGMIALLLAGIGVYGVISYAVARRTQEIGVRVALGARNRDVFGMVLREAGWLAGIGVAIGLVGAFGITRVIANFLIGVSPTDPLSFVSVSFFLTGIALFASYVPARRAMRVDPLVALRSD